MKQKHLFSLLDNSATTIRVVFPKDEMARQEISGQLQKRFNDPALEAQPRTYVYKVPKDWALKVDDHVVIDSPRGFAVARVVSIDASAQIDVDADFDYRWAVQRVDMTAYEARVAKENSFSGMMLDVERTRQREALLEDMRKHLPEGSAARALFEDATKLIEVPAPVTPPMPGSV